jgi:hypothetical protein
MEARMLTLRRGVARVGWVSLALWVAVWGVLVVVLRTESQHPPPLDASIVLHFAAVVFGSPLAIFLLWRLVLWIGQGFWQLEAASMTAPAPKAFQLPSGFWTVRTMALLGAVLFAAYGAFGLQLDGRNTARVVGGLVAYAAIGAILGAVMARFLPKA